jgi:hypothetical protein
VGDSVRDRVAASGVLDHVVVLPAVIDWTG